MAVKLRQRKLQKGTRFYLDIYISASDRTSQFLDIWLLSADTPEEKKDKKELARQIRNRTEQDMESKKYREVLPKFRKETDFLLYAKNYIENYKNRDKRSIKAAVKHFKKFLKSKKRSKLAMTEFNESIAYDFIEYLKKDSGLSASTPAGYLEKLTGIIKAAMRDKYMLNNPFEFLSKKGLNKDGIAKNVLNNQELGMLFSTVCSNIGIRKAFIIACYTGMGEAEIRNLKWSDINFKSKIIKYKRLKTEITATNHLHSMIEQQFFGLDRSTDYVFEGLLPTSTNGINKVIRTWVKHAGIDKHMTFYCGRHTFGTSVCRVSGNQKVVAEAMGHKSTRFTDRYTKIVEEEHIKAVQGLPSFSAEVS
jgi:integrase